MFWDKIGAESLYNGADGPFCENCHPHGSYRCGHILLQTAVPLRVTERGINTSGECFQWCSLYSKGPVRSIDWRPHA